MVFQAVTIKKPYSFSFSLWFYESHNDIDMQYYGESYLALHYPHPNCDISIRKKVRKWKANPYKLWHFYTEPSHGSERSIKDTEPLILPSQPPRPSQFIYQLNLALHYPYTNCDFSIRIWNQAMKVKGQPITKIINPLLSTATHHINIHLPPTLQSQKHLWFGPSWADRGKLSMLMGRNWGW